MSSDATRDEICVVACADAFRGDGEIMASPMLPIPALGARLAKRTFAPDLVLTDGVAAMQEWGVVEGWMPYRKVFDVVWWGRRHVFMGASQLDRYGNQNLSCIGDWRKPSSQLLGVRGAPGNTICHTTSYWVPKHGKDVFVDAVDMASGVGYDRAAALGPRASRFHEIRVVVTNLAVLDFATPDHRMRLKSVHRGVSVDEVVAATGFELALPASVPETRLPTAIELELIRAGLK